MTLVAIKRNGKRGSDESDYLPVTKRMYKLHIDGSNEAHDPNMAMSEPNVNESTLGINHSERFTGNHNQSHTAVNSNSIHQNGCPQEKAYSPELDCSQNPMYYEANKILYEAYIQRTLRTSITCRQTFKKS